MSSSSLVGAAKGRKFFDPDALLESIANGSIALMRGRWLVAHAEGGGKLMRRQDLPPEAFFSVDELRKLVAALGDDWGLLFVAISYRWLTAMHPDPDAFHLKIIAKVAKLYLKAEKKYLGTFSCSPLVDAFERAGYRRDEADFGLMWDFMSLHQKPVDGGERTTEEAALFKGGVAGQAVNVDADVLQNPFFTINEAHHTVGHHHVGKTFVDEGTGERFGSSAHKGVRR